MRHIEPAQRAHPLLPHFIQAILGTTQEMLSVSTCITKTFGTPNPLTRKENPIMSVLVTLKTPDNTTKTKFYWNAEARVNANHVLQVIRYRSVIAEFTPDSYSSWEYVLPEALPQVPSRAGQL